MTLFTKIIQGEIPCVKLAETDSCIAFMDIHPLKKGHVLVVPKVEVDEIYALDDKDLTDLCLFAKKISIAMKKTFNTRIGLWVEGLEVPHAHIHLLPIENGRDFIFDYPRLKLSQGELSEIANEIFLNFE